MRDSPVLCAAAWVLVPGLLCSSALAADTSRYEADRVRIQAHLARVEQELRAADVHHLPPARAERRARLLDALHDYASAGEFPHNDDVPGLSPVFIDDGGRACAVGHLMLEDGAVEAAFEVAASENLAYVPDLTAPRALAWARESGFRVDELARIQPSYTGPGACQGEPRCIDTPCTLPAGFCSPAPGWVCDRRGGRYASECVAATCLQFDVSPELCFDRDARGCGCEATGTAPPAAAIALALAALGRGALVRRRRR